MSCADALHRFCRRPQIFTLRSDRDALRRRYRHIADVLKHWRRQIRRVPSGLGSVKAVVAYRNAVRGRHWTSLRDMLPDLVRTAEQAGDHRMIEEYRQAADRLGLYELGARLQRRYAPPMRHPRWSEWTGEPLSKAQLVVDFHETPKQGAAIGLSSTAYVAAVAHRAAALTIVCEPRLTPIYARTFPQARVVAGPAIVEPPDGLSGYVANARVLRSVLASSPADLPVPFVPLKADPQQVAHLRRRYRGETNRPLIGLAWWSSHHGKDLPSLSTWAKILRGRDAGFVSLQYGDRAEDIEELRRLSDCNFFADASVDQLTDMDLFAAQIDALDAVVTISCTGAHLACALGKPTLLIRDDWFRRDWPVLSDKTPWHPTALVVGRNGRSWDDAFTELATRLDHIIT